MGMVASRCLSFRLFQDFCIGRVAENQADVVFCQFSQKYLAH